MCVLKSCVGWNRLEIINEDVIESVDTHDDCWQSVKKFWKKENEKSIDIECLLIKPKSSFSFTDIEYIL